MLNCRHIKKIYFFSVPSADLLIGIDGNQLIVNGQNRQFLKLQQDSRMDPRQETHYVREVI